MEMNDYQKEAAKFAEYDLMVEDEPVHLILGLVYRVGLLAEVGHAAKGLTVPDDSEKEIIRKRLGDILWHVSELARNLGMELSAVADQSLERLGNIRSDHSPQRPAVGGFYSPWPEILDEAGEGSPKE